MILLTSATGSMGRYLIDALTSDGADARAVTRHPRTPGLPARVEVIEGDLSRDVTQRGMIARGFPEPIGAALMARYASTSSIPPRTTRRRFSGVPCSAMPTGSPRTPANPATDRKAGTNA
jgi:nucleoside-diphosphate-sugar epimerase